MFCILSTLNCRELQIRVDAAVKIDGDAPEKRESDTFFKLEYPHGCHKYIHGIGMTTLRAHRTKRAFDGSYLQRQLSLAPTAATVYEDEQVW